MRTRLIVAIAALMAASALVAVPDPVGSTNPSATRRIESTSLTPLSIALPSGSTATTIPSDDTANRSAGRLEPGSAFPEVDLTSPDLGRGSVDQPVVSATVQKKNPWRTSEVSWYGSAFYGHGTACGQKYSSTIIGVAHKTLPCGTLLTFRNPKNGRVVTARVIDRGPYVAGREFDLSRGLCVALGHCYTGNIQWHLGG